MYTLLTPEEEATFVKEVDVVMQRLGRTHTVTELTQYFAMGVRDLVVKNIVCVAYKGSFVLHDDFMEVTKFECSEDLLITESGGLQELVCKMAIKQLIDLAKVNNCKELVIYTKNSIVLETLFQHKFDLAIINKASKVIKSKLLLCPEHS